MSKFSQFDDMDSNAENSGLEMKPKMKNSKKIWVFGIIVILLLSAIYTLGGAVSKSAKWQTVFLNNGQAYFGRLSGHGDTYVLSDVFYLRTNPNFQPTTPSATAFDIVKLGGELHGPENVMYIPKTAILFWENMRTDSQVVQAIENFLKSAK